MKSKTTFLNAAAAEPAPQFLTFLNATPSEDGWMHVAPIGDFEGIARVPDGKGGVTKFKAVQRIDKQAIAAMINDQKANTRGLTKFVKAPPLFVGHPDAEPHRYPDHKPKGVFVNFKEDAQGLHAETILTDEGDKLVAGKKYPGISARFDTEFVNEENGVKIYRPVRFVSAGLVLNPNLPTFLNETLAAEITNEATSATAMTASKQASKAGKAATASGSAEDHAKAFTAHAAAAAAHEKAAGLATADEDETTAKMHQDMAATHDQAAMAHLKACQAAGGKCDITNEHEKTLAARCEPADPKNKNMNRNELAAALKKYGATITNEAEDSALMTALDQLGQRAAGASDAQTRLTKSETDFTNERQARITDLVGHALESGRITGAEKPDWERRLKADFANESAALVKLTSKVKTASVINRGDAKPEELTAAQRTTFCNEVIDELAGKHKLDRAKDYNRLFTLAQQTRPDLFGAMKKSAFKKK